MNEQKPNRPSLEHALSHRDLTDPAQGEHPMQRLVHALHEPFAHRYGCRRLLQHSAPIVGLDDHRALLAGADRDHLRLHPRLVLRSRISTELPAMLKSVSLDPPDDLLWIAAGLCFPRAGSTPRHELLLCRLGRVALNAVALGEMLHHALPTAVGERRYRLLPAAQPHLRGGMRIDTQIGAEWVEVGHCGELAPTLLTSCGISEPALRGLVLELDLDRCLTLQASAGTEELPSACAGDA